MLHIPGVQAIGKDGSKYSTDILSHLLQDRIIMLFSEINQNVAGLVISQLLYLDSIDHHKDIRLYIHSFGGEVSAGLAIIDAMRLVQCDVSTLCLGTAASMGALILAAGAKGKRSALPHAEMMIHQPLGGISGQASDIFLQADRMKRTKDVLNRLLGDLCGRAIDQIQADTDRDYFMNASEAMEYGLIDAIIR